MYPSLGVINIPFVIAVNRRVASEDAFVTYLDEIAILPPINGDFILIPQDVPHTPLAK